MQMCHWPRMEHNKQNQWPLLVFSSLSGFLPALLSFEKCVICSCRCTNLCWITASPPADIASTLPAQIPPSEEASVCNGPVNCVLFFFSFFSLYSGRIKSYWCQIKFRLWDTESDACQIESGHGVCFFTYTSGGFIHIHLTRQRQSGACLLWSRWCVLFHCNCY